MFKILFLVMKIKVIFYIIFIFISYNILSQTSWYPQNTGTNKNIYCLYFNDANFGYAGCDSIKFLKTTNGGSNWTQYTLDASTGYGNRYITSIRFVNNSTGFACNWYNVYKTTNGGQSWDSLNGIKAREVYFIDQNTGWLVHEGQVGGKIYKTTNSGINWTELGYSPSWIVNSAVFINENTGFICGNLWTMFMNLYNAQIFRSINTGTNWSNVYLSSMTTGVLQTIWDIYFPNSSMGYAVGLESQNSTPTFYRTTNSGINWMTSPLGFTLKAIHFTNAGTGWGTGENKIYYTSNSGTNWETQFNTAAVMNSIYMLNTQTGWAAGNNGYIYKTTTGGSTALEPLSNIVPKEYKLHQNYPNPFNPTTKIKFDIPNPSLKGGRGDDLVQLVIYNTLGQEIQTLVNEQLSPGTYEVEWFASIYPSGVYFYKLTVSDFTETKRMVLLK